MNDSKQAGAELTQCSLCDKPVEFTPEGAMIHPDGTGHEEWPVERQGVEW